MNSSFAQKAVVLTIILVLLGTSLSSAGSYNQFGWINRQNTAHTEKTTGKTYETFRNMNDLIPTYLTSTVAEGTARFDGGFSVQTTADGGYIVAGLTEGVNLTDGEFYYFDALLMKYTTDGNQEWNKTFEGLGIAMCYACQQTTDNGYILTGYTRPALDEAMQLLLLKTDNQGNKQWEKAFPGPTGFNSQGRSVQQTNDGGYLIGGHYINVNTEMTKMVLIKTDTLGNPVWTKVFVYGNATEGTSVQQTTEGGYIAVGTRIFYTPAYAADALLLKLNSTGAMEWNSTYTLTNVTADVSVQQTSDGGYILSGATYLGDNPAAFVLKTNSTGMEEWNATLSGFSFSEGVSVTQTNDTGYMVSGYAAKTSQGAYNVLLFKTNASGIIQWNATYAISGFDCIGYALDITRENGSIITGFIIGGSGGMEMDGLLIKTTGNGTKQWMKRFEWREPDLPAVVITQPTNGLYFNSRKIIRFSAPVAVGPIEILVNASDITSGVKRVEFYVDETLLGNDTTAPYAMNWKKLSFFSHHVTVVAVDKAGNKASASLVVWKFF